MDKSALQNLVLISPASHLSARPTLRNDQTHMTQDLDPRKAMTAQ